MNPAAVNIRKALIGILFLLSPFICQSQSLLWKISGNDLSMPSYLYGTIHISDPAVFEWKSWVYSYVDSCEAFAAELDLSMETMITIAGKMMLPEGQTLHDHFTPEEYDLIAKAVKECSGYELSMFNRIKPPALIAICFGNNPPEGLEATVDELLYRYARSKDIPTFGIEKIEEQIALFDEIPDSYVVEYFRNIDNQGHEMETLIRCYRNADLDSLLILIQDEESGALLNDELIKKRNYRMTERIIPLIKDQAVFIAIGSGHLPGDEGLIALLRKEGYTLEPVMK